MQTFLVFLKDMVSAEEFVLPVNAPTREAAMVAAAKHSPIGKTQVLTCYTDNELQRILTDAQRWPGATGIESPTVPLKEALPLQWDPAQQATAQKAQLAFTRLQQRREEQLFSRPLLPEQPKALSEPAPAASQAPVTLAMALASIRQPKPQNAQPATTSRTPPTAAADGFNIAAKVEESAPVTSIKTMPKEPLQVQAAISRRPQPAEAAPPTQARSVVDVFRGLRK